MSATRKAIERNLQQVRENIAAACRRAGRSPGEITLVAVTKSADMDAIRAAADLGLTDLGESRVQELVDRAEQLQARRPAGAAQVRWHMIGHLQRNKVRPLVPAVHAIHSLDSLRLAEELNLRAERAERRLDVLLQVNCSEEPQKSGVAVGAALHLGELICTLRHLRLIGLMVMAPLTDKPERARRTFVRLRELFEEMQGQKLGGADFAHMSMGMSQDYTVAVEEGATFLRIGTAIFG